MSRRLSVRLSDALAEGVESRARRSGKTKSDIVRDALTAAGLGVKHDRRSLPDLLQRAAALRAGQSEATDAVALIREVRSGSALRLQLMRLTIPIMQGDLA